MKSRKNVEFSKIGKFHDFQKILIFFDFPSHNASQNLKNIKWNFRRTFFMSFLFPLCNLRRIVVAISLWQPSEGHNGILIQYSLIFNYVLLGHYRKCAFGAMTNERSWMFLHVKSCIFCVSFTWATFYRLISSFSRLPTLIKTDTGDTSG